MNKSIINFLRKADIQILILILLLSGFSLQAQNKHRIVNKMYIDAAGFVYISTGDTVNYEGNVTTARDFDAENRGMMSFAGAADWKSDNGSFVNGYVRSHKTGAFIFPIGQGTYRPAAISAATDANPTDAGYYNTAQYSAANLDIDVAEITDESWIIKGTTAAVITLSWSSDLSAFVESLEQLSIVGWDISAGKWVTITSVAEPISSIFQIASNIGDKGSISTAELIVPNAYAAYSLGKVRNYKANVIGTVFPFVRWNNETFDTLFTITVNLKSIPDPQAVDPLDDLIQETPLYFTEAVYYDGSIYVPNSPKSPGLIGALNNFGLPIDWEDAIGIPGEAPVTDILQDDGEQPLTVNGLTLGLFMIKDVTEGDYILEILREGFVTRWAKIKVNAEEPDNFFGHREIIPGDVNNDLRINIADVSDMTQNIGSNYTVSGTNYAYGFDLDANGQVNQFDYNLILKFTGFWYYHYRETKTWLDELGINY